MTKQLHWFSYSFQEAKGNTVATASAYIGYPEKAVTKARIDAAKTCAQVSDGAVLLNVSYLGYMTRDQFLGESELTESANDPR